MTKRIYFDHAATTPLRPEVLEVFVDALTTCNGNANSLHHQGREAMRALEDARMRIVRALGGRSPQELIFTSGGTESNNTAIHGILSRLAAQKPGPAGHVVTSSFEHHAVLNPINQLKHQGYEITPVKPRENGFIHPDDVRAVMRDDTKLVSIMMANNEIGTVQSIRELARIAHEHKAYFHTDAVQALGKIPLDMRDLDVDAASFSAHKLYGPKGVGALYIKRGTPFAPLLLGGGQETKRRSGTQNVPGAVAFARAVELAALELDEQAKLQRELRDLVIDLVTSRIPRSRSVVCEGERLPGLAPLIIEGVEGESVLLHLDDAGFEVSTGSACSSNSLEPSHVLRAIGVPKDRAQRSLRISFGRENTTEQVRAFVDALVLIVEKLRSF